MLPLAGAEGELADGLTIAAPEDSEALGEPPLELTPDEVAD
jgi:hypothetical protein